FRTESPELRPPFRKGYATERVWPARTPPARAPSGIQRPGRPVEPQSAAAVEFRCHPHAGRSARPAFAISDVRIQSRELRAVRPRDVAIVQLSLPRRSGVPARRARHRLQRPLLRGSFSRASFLTANALNTRLPDARRVAGVLDHHFGGSEDLG